MLCGWRCTPQHKLDFLLACWNLKEKKEFSGIRICPHERGKQCLKPWISSIYFKLYEKLCVPHWSYVWFGDYDFVSHHFSCITFISLICSLNLGKEENFGKIRKNLYVWNQLFMSFDGSVILCSITPEWQIYTIELNQMYIWSLYGV